MSTAHLTAFAEAGLSTPRHVGYYGARARGGVALVVLESTPVHPTGNAFSRSIQPYDPRARPGLGRIADAVHGHGTAVVAQLWHCGRQGSSAVTGMPLWAPSAVACPVSREVPKEMTLSEIRELVDAFGSTAREFLAAGFDGVEVAAGHGYLVHQFLSPLSNVRTDAYGGAEENRARFLEETLDCIRAFCGRDFVLGVRLSADELLPGGFAVQDSLRLVRSLARRGTVDYLSISAGTHASAEQMVGDWSVPRGHLVGLAHAVRGVAEGIPVIACGRIVEPEHAEEILRRGDADLIGLSRALIADPDWAAKAEAGRSTAIRPCIACNECESRLFKGLALACAVNPEIVSGRDEIRRARVPARVMVVGGGPAGLEAARTAALRGHRVVLFEQADALGGQLRLVDELGTRPEYARIVAFLERELSRLGVDVRVGCRADSGQVLREGADVVIVATGCVRNPPPAGAEGRPRLMSPDDLAGARGQLGRRVVVWDGGAAHDRLLAIAEAALAAGREVFVVTPAPRLGADLSFISLSGILRRLREHHARVFTDAEARLVGAGCVEVQEVRGGHRSRLQEIDTVVMVARNRPESALRNELDGKIPRLLSAGDCVAPRGLEHAFREGRTAGLGV